MKLTPKQKEIIKAMRKTGEIIEMANGYWWLGGRIIKFPTINALNKHGLLNPVMQYGYYANKYDLTDLGKTIEL